MTENPRLDEADPDKVNNPLRYSIYTRKLDMDEFPDWFSVTDLEIETETGDLLVHWKEENTHPAADGRVTTGRGDVIQHQIETAVDMLEIGAGASAMGSLMRAYKAAGGDAADLTDSFDEEAFYDATDEAMKRWADDARSNTEEWGTQHPLTIIAAIMEELGEISQAYLEATHEGGSEGRTHAEIDDLAPMFMQLSESLGQHPGAFEALPTREQEQEGHIPSDAVADWVSGKVEENRQRENRRDNDGLP